MVKRLTQFIVRIRWLDGVRFGRGKGAVGNGKRVETEEEVGGLPGRGARINLELALN